MLVLKEEGTGVKGVWPEEAIHLKFCSGQGVCEVALNKSTVIAHNEIPAGLLKKPINPRGYA